MVRCFSAGPTIRSTQARYGGLRRSCARRRTPARIRELERAQQHAGLGAVAHAEFFEDRAHVRLHRAFLDAQLVGDLLVEAALGDAYQHLELLRAERGQARGGGVVLGVGGDRRRRRGAARAAAIPRSRAPRAGRPAIRPGRRVWSGSPRHRRRGRGEWSPGRRARRSSPPRPPDVRHARSPAPSGHDCRACAGRAGPGRCRDGPPVPPGRRKDPRLRGCSPPASRRGPPGVSARRYSGWSSAISRRVMARW